MTITVSELAEKIGAIVVGDGARKISSIASLEEAGPGQASFLSNPKYEKMLGTTGAAAVIASKTTRSNRVTILHAMIRISRSCRRWCCCMGIGSIHIAVCIRWRMLIPRPDWEAGA